MTHNIIAQSKSGKTHVILNNDGTIGFNNNTPICTLAQLKWLKMQPNFRPGFLARIPDTYFENLQPEAFDITALPVISIAVKLDFGGKVDDVRTWYGKNINGCFCSFRKDGNIAFMANILIDQDWEFLNNGETLEMFEERRKQEKEKAELRNQEWLKEMYAPARGWYVVTMEILVGKIKGNDGTKTYSFKVLAENQMDAYEKVCNNVRRDGVNDRNVSFVYHIQDSASSALIEYVGMWTDEAELEYGAEK